MRIAIYQPDQDLQDACIPWINRLGLRFRAFQEFTDLLIALRSGTFDLIIFEWQGAHRRALELLRGMRTQTPLPCLITLPDTLLPQSLAWPIDAPCEQLTHPMRFADFAEKMQRLLMIGHPLRMSSSLEIAGYTFQPARHQVQLPAALSSQPEVLTHKEFELALILFRNVGRALSRCYLMDFVWGPGSPMSSRSLDTHISRLRIKLQLTDDAELRITPIYGFGYRLDSAHDVRPQRPPRHHAMHARARIAAYP